MSRTPFNNKWVTTASSILIQTTSGTPSTFGIYSSALKSSQSYTQSTLDVVSVFKDLGANLGLLAGLLYTQSTIKDHNHDHNRQGWWYGPRVVILVGSALCFVGYVGTWLTVVGVFGRLPVAVVCVFMALAGQSMPFFNTADVVTSVLNFREYSGTAVGIMKGFLGLSGAILIQVYRTIFKNDSTGFLLMVSILCSLNPLWLMWFVNIHEGYDGNEKEPLNSFSIVIVVLAAYLVAVIILESILSFPLWAHILVLAGILLMLASPLLIAIRAIRTSSYEAEKIPLVVENPPEIEKVDVGYRQLPDPGDREGHPSDKSTGEEPNINLLEAMRTVNFWLLFLASACGIGSGLATLNNITQIGESLGYSSTETSTLVSLWGIWNSLGRFGAGYASDYILHKNGWPRPLFMAITLATMSIGHAVIASGLTGALYAGSILAGICYGSQLSLMPTIASEIFGVVHMGTIFNTITVAGPLGSYALSVWVVGYIYDKEATGDGNTCTGVKCFMLSFFIMAAVTLLGSLFAITMYWRTKSFYDRVIVRRLKHASRE
ncbi:NUCLEAR FUSION DEFECTIVE 4-like protein [Drosera capensis]